MGQFPNPDTQFKPGNNANPRGRPRGASPTAKLRELLDRGEINGQQIKDGKQVADLLAEVLLKAALKGDIRAIQYVFDRVDGKALERVETSEVNVEELDDDELRAIARPAGKGRTRTPKA